MAQGLHPTDGARVLLELVEGRADGADYRGEIYTPQDRFSYAVAIDAQKAIRVTAVAAAAPDALVDLLRKIARGVANDGLAEVAPAWPRRVLRWRDR